MSEGHIDALEQYNRLIVASPDLLKACKLAFAIIKAMYEPYSGDTQLEEAYNALESAIFKAEGKEQK